MDAVPSTSETAWQAQGSAGGTETAWTIAPGMGSAEAPATCTATHDTGSAGFGVWVGSGVLAQAAEARMSAIASKKGSGNRRCARTTLALTSRAGDEKAARVG